MSDAMKAGGEKYVYGDQIMHGINGDQKKKGRTVAITADHTHEDGFAAGCPE